MRYKPQRNRRCKRGVFVPRRKSVTGKLGRQNKDAGEPGALPTRESEDLLDGVCRVRPRDLGAGTVIFAWKYGRAALRSGAAFVFSILECGGRQ